MAVFFSLFCFFLEKKTQKKTHQPFLSSLLPPAPLPPPPPSNDTAPALVLLFGSIFLLRDTPSSLAGRGLLAEGRAELERLRGSGGGKRRRRKAAAAAAGADSERDADGDDDDSADLEREWDTIASAAAAEANATAAGTAGGGAHGEENGKSSGGKSTGGGGGGGGCSSFLLVVREDLSSIAALFQRRALPATAVGVGIAALSQVCGINAILFFAAPFFSSLSAAGSSGGGEGASSPASSSGLLSAVVVGLALFGFTLVALALVDRVGRRALLLVGGGVMLATELSLAGLLGYYLPGGGSKSPSSSSGQQQQQQLLPRGAAAGALFLMCCFVAAFASSLGPLGWLVPTEVFSAKDRSAGQALATTVNFLFVFVTTQFFLASLCAMRHWTFVAAAAAVVVLLLFAQFLMPVSEEGVFFSRLCFFPLFFFRDRGLSDGTRRGKNSTSASKLFFFPDPKTKYRRPRGSTSTASPSCGGTTRSGRGSSPQPLPARRTGEEEGERRSAAGLSEVARAERKEKRERCGGGRVALEEREREGRVGFCFWSRFLVSTERH